MGLSIKADFAELQGANGAENFGRLMSIFMWVYAVLQPGQRLYRRPHQPQMAYCFQPRRLVRRHAGDGARPRLPDTLLAARGDGRERGVLHSRRAVAHRGLSSRRDALAGGGHSHERHLSRPGARRRRRLGGAGHLLARGVRRCGVIGVGYAIVLCFFLRERNDRDTVPLSSGGEGSILPRDKTLRASTGVASCF